MRDNEEEEKRRKGEEEREQGDSSLIPHPSSLSASLPIFYDEQKVRWPRLKRFVVVSLLRELWRR